MAHKLTEQVLNPNSSEKKHHLANEVFYERTYPALQCFFSNGHPAISVKYGRDWSDTANVEYQLWKTSEG